MTDSVEVTNEVQGLYRVKAGRRDENGNFVPRVDTGWFGNLITNNGLDQMGDSSTWHRHCYVGTDSTTPQFTDNDLGNRIAGVDGGLSDNFVTRSQGVLGESPYYAWARYVYEFAEGVAEGNLAEVGTGWDADPAAGIFSRALIVDSEGNPTTITVLSNEVLQVTYEVRVYPSSLDATGVVTLGGVDYDYTMRPHRAGYYNQASGWYLGAMGANGTYPAPWNTYGRASESDVLQAWDDNSGIATPYENITSFSVDSDYVAGSYYRDGTIFIALEDCNFPTGIGSMNVKFGWGSWFLHFSPKIPKDDTNTLSLTLRHSWARR